MKVGDIVADGKVVIDLEINDKTVDKKIDTTDKKIDKFVRFLWLGT